MKVWRKFAVLAVMAVTLGGCAGTLTYVGMMGNLACYDYSRVGSFMTLGTFACLDEKDNPKIVSNGNGPGAINGTAGAASSVGQAFGTGNNTGTAFGDWLGEGLGGNRFPDPPRKK